MPILHWLNKDEAVTAAKRSAYRLLKEVPELSYGDPDNENLLIQGDNLEALKALIPFYAGKVKCIFIDPPYNTKSAFEHYDDNLEHSKWLSLMYPRLEILRDLLTEDGSIWATIDDRESHYLKVLMDEVFGRENFIANCIWQKKFSPQNDAKWISDNHDHIIVFAKSKKNWHPTQLLRSEDMDNRYKNPDKDPRGPWASTDLTRAEHRDRDFWALETPSGKKVYPARGRSWSRPKENIEKLMSENRLWFGPNGDRMPRIKKFLAEVKGGITPMSVWLHSDVGHNQEAKKEVVLLNHNEVFATPKPERLIQRILHIASNKNDFILDSFLGSGTTAAVAHKMNRRYIGIEIGEHAKTHCQPRLKKVIEGEQGGISKAVDWQGGGGFRFCKLGETVFDEYGTLNPEIKFPALAAHIWYLETRTPLNQTGKKKVHSPFLGEYKGTAYYLLYNGILGDRRPQGGNVLTSKILDSLPDIDKHQGKIVIYGESSRLGDTRLKQANITFKQIPYDVGSL